ncbi:3'-5' exonuclease [Metabacillus fastidiosus]|uniref:3'-5' exonuclease n=1 Tax=Metabacillus fastidiosus TaxID=1458 RepID=UPI002DB5ABAB|nr:3'-5' exonuclease [Metabacillus fastidiosus]MEC2077984.1 3'-5' exonuclease [Metabacillus fastidiosus]
MLGEELIEKKWLVSEEELDDDQYKVKQLQMGNYIIEGSAGSGKTVLALHKAKEIQDLRLGTYLVIVYTNTLKTFIKDGVTSLGLSPDRVCNYHQLKKLGFDSADYIIVDEILDFGNKAVQNLINMAKKNFIFFGDDAQQLYSTKTANISIDKVINISNINHNNHITLNKNYRLPIPIAEFAQQISLLEKNLTTCCVKNGGEKPLIIKHKTFTDELDTIYDIISKEGWGNCCILVHDNEEVKKVKDYYESKGLDIEYKYNNKNSQGESTIDFYTDIPKVMTYHSSKGLQFQHVFLPNCTISTTQYDYRDALYVAVTRASETLIITYSNSLSPYINRVKREYYDLQIK